MCRSSNTWQKLDCESEKVHTKPMVTCNHKKKTYNIPCGMIFIFCKLRSYSNYIYLWLDVEGLIRYISIIRFLSVCTFSMRPVKDNYYCQIIQKLNWPTFTFVCLMIVQYGIRRTVLYYIHFNITEKNYFVCSYINYVSESSVRIKYSINSSVSRSSSVYSQI